MHIEENVDLARHCTMELGGRARYFVRVADEATLRAALDWAAQRALPTYVLGGGSNVVIADDGLDGIVLRIAFRGISTRADGREVSVTVSAGETWDDVVAWSVERRLQGLECLSGIPGDAGATPIQNVGAYGQEVSEVISEVTVYDRREKRRRKLPSDACGFAYRNSVFKRAARDRYIVLSVTLKLKHDGPPTLRYPELETALREHTDGNEPTLGDVRQTVLALRRKKSMVVDPDDMNRRSCGSFFLNPMLNAEAVDAIRRSVRDASVPAFPLGDGTVKVSAAWLIEQAGFERGTREGNVGLSSRHSLAVVCHDGATAAEVIAFARRIRDRVRQKFGVTLVPEPNIWGFERGLD